MSLPTPIIQVLQHFRPAFTSPTWHKVQILVVGTLLARGRRTVTAALKQMGLHQDQHFTLYHQLLNRACWSSLIMSRRLLQLLIATFIASGGTLEIVIDETLERRWGPKISKRGRHRDKMKSTKHQSVTSSGLRWVVMMLVVQLPWTHRAWALPFFSVLATTPKVSEKLGKPHKTIAQIAQQMVITVRRWFPDAAQVPMKLIGDTAYSTVELGLCCAKHNVTLVAPLRLDSRLYEPAPDTTDGQKVGKMGRRRYKGQKGRPRVKGAALPKVSSVLDNPTTEWVSVKVRWYDASEQTLQMVSGTGVWYRTGLPALPLKWVLTRDPGGKREPKAYFSTDIREEAQEIIGSFIKRWTIEVTFEESREHLGVETQRQWSDLAIERSTPGLLGLYSLVAVFGKGLYPDGKIPVHTTAWYRKREATFSDVLAVVRRELWGNFTYRTSDIEPDVLLVPRSHIDRFAYALCY
jgi:hypothetical protein